MGTAPKLMLALLSLGCLTLAGCANCFDPAQRPSAFVASPPHHRPAAEQTMPQSAAPQSSSLEKCNQELYLGGAATPGEIRAAEATCRATIVNQPY